MFGMSMEIAWVESTSALPVLVMASLLAGCSPALTSEQSSNPEFLQKRSSQHVRVTSFNVNVDSIFPDDDPQNHPARSYSKSSEFVRIMKAIDPDVVCLQEINPVRDPQQITSILDVALPLSNGKHWQSHSGSDNVIASRFDLSLRAEESAPYGVIPGIGHAMALVDLPDEDFEKDLYLICAHFHPLAGQENIRARQEHADTIVRRIRGIRNGEDANLPANTPFIVLGDFNVYDTDPAGHLTTLVTGDIEYEDKYGVDIAPDWDDTALADALPSHNASGDETYTWRDDTQEFNPGALDHILYTDAVISVGHAFVLNTTVLTETELSAAGLQAGDVALDLEEGRYDHLPIVVDIEARDR